MCEAPGPAFALLSWARFTGFLCVFSSLFLLLFELQVLLPPEKLEGVFQKQKETHVQQWDLRLCLAPGLHFSTFSVAYFPLLWISLKGESRNTFPFIHFP